ncbi:hypothetical protein EMIHUDRAFT_221133 [Emiliania huxleyi CCMP1516]|uniref:Uncharacterized protein n=2 Tax=Emiliania huxleyi TaxID=2903 RepID=A0A0D3HZB9_EMIH1|nr:hypothetical protein EMIHUDRAFT_221133 [Emiliania huxleyi CCMP1516]EOD04354.1 hypothetical protein EMIHUDRAFT_221133 [Emiliania huxleyi CCMP1516]|eukprot:XP_005756783.1 hypothetical protein EMIHUDRAFT_221133 [Emiliania huxleyi CCMP1516]
MNNVAVSRDVPHVSWLRPEAMLGIFALTPSLPVPLPALHSRNIQAGQFAPGEPVPMYQFAQGQGEPVPMYQFAQGQGEPVPVYQYSSGMAAQPYANQHWAEVPPGTVAPQGAPAGYFYDGAPSAEPLRYDSTVLPTAARRCRHCKSELRRRLWCDQSSTPPLRGCCLCPSAVTEVEGPCTHS